MLEANLGSGSPADEYGESIVLGCSASRSSNTYTCVVYGCGSALEGDVPCHSLCTRGGDHKWFKTRASDVGEISDRTPWNPAFHDIRRLIESGDEFLWAILSDQAGGHQGAVGYYRDGTCLQAHPSSATVPCAYFRFFTEESGGDWREGVQSSARDSDLPRDDSM